MHKVANVKDATEEEQVMKSEVPLLTSCRVTLAIVATVGTFFYYVLRLDLSIGIVCMARDTLLNDSRENSSSWANTSSAPAQEEICGGTDQGSSRNLNGEFDWDKQLRGNILSSFFYGYIISQVPGGYIASRFGAKYVFGNGMLVAIVATMLTPVAARTSPYALMALRITMGLFMGACLPALHCLLGRWAPPLERSKMASFIYGGIILGSVAAMSISGLFCGISADNGWPLIFYVYGCVAFLWWISWMYCVYNTPEIHPRISQSERDYILTAIGEVEKKNLRHVPWKSILRSPAVWAIVAAHACSNWGAYTIQTTIPMYMKEVLYFDVKANGALSALPFAAMWVVAVVAGYLADVLQERKILRTVTVRKLWQAIAFLCPAALLIAMTFMTCEQRYPSVALLTLAVGSTGFNRSGYVVSHIDIAHRYAGILYGISNTVATIPGMVAPTVVGLLTPTGSREEWQRVFFICAGVYTFGAIVFTIWARGEEQSWAKAPKDEMHVHCSKEDVLMTDKDIS